MTLTIQFEVRHALNIVLVDEPKLLCDAVAFIDVQNAGRLSIGGLATCSFW